MPRRDGTGPLGKGPVAGGSRGGMRSTRGRMGGQLSAGSGGHCVCPKCNYRIPHTVGQPCNARICPECGTIMVRE